MWLTENTLLFSNILHVVVCTVLICSPKTHLMRMKEEGRRCWM